MRLAKTLVLVAVAVLLTGGTGLAEDTPEELIIKISQPGGQGTPLKIDVLNSEGTDAFTGSAPGIPPKAQAKMDGEDFKMRDTAVVVISNPCGWVYANGRWYWRCW